MSEDEIDWGAERRKVRPVVMSDTDPWKVQRYTRADRVFDRIAFGVLGGVGIAVIILAFANLAAGSGT